MVLTRSSVPFQSTCVFCPCPFFPIFTPSCDVIAAWDSDNFVGKTTTTDDSSDTKSSTWDAGVGSRDASFGRGDAVEDDDSDAGRSRDNYGGSGSESSGRHREYNDSDIVDSALNGHGREHPSSTGAGEPQSQSQAQAQAQAPGQKVPQKISGPAYCGVVGIADFMMGGAAGGALGFIHTFGDAFQLDMFAGGRPQPGAF